MPRRPTTFRQSDIKRAIAAAKAAGMEIDRVEIDLATVRIIVIAKGDASANTESALDTWKKNRAYTRTS